MKTPFILPFIALLVACAKAPEKFRSSYVEFDFPAAWTISADSSEGDLYIELLSPDSDAMLLSAMPGVMPPEFILDGFWSAYSHSLPESFQLVKSDSLRFCYFGGYEARCLDYTIRAGGQVIRGDMYSFNASGNTFTLQRHAGDSTMSKFMQDTEIVESTIYFP